MIDAMVLTNENFCVVAQVCGSQLVQGLKCQAKECGLHSLAVGSHWTVVLRRLK